MICLHCGHYINPDREMAKVQGSDNCPCPCHKGYISEANPMCETKPRTPIDAYAVALDETDHYAIEKADRPYIEKIIGVYLLDRNQRTNCCELTPSYWLIHLYDQVVLTEAGRKLDDLSVDALHQKYEYCGNENIYVHCHSIDALIERNILPVYHYGDPEVDEDDVDYDDQMEGIREYLCGNCPF